MLATMQYISEKLQQVWNSFSHQYICVNTHRGDYLALFVAIKYASFNNGSLEKDYTRAVVTPTT